MVFCTLGSLSNHDDGSNENITNFARFAREFLILGNFADVLVLSTTLNHLFCSCVDEESR